MVKIICDKCKNECETYSVFTVHIFAPEIKYWAEDPLNGDRHFCRDCMRDICKFVNEEA